MTRRIKVAATSELLAGEGTTVEADGKELALFNVDGVFYAIDNTCTHVGGPLGDGTLDGEIVSCPWHGAEFNVATGEVVCPPGEKNVRTYPVTVEGDDVFVDLGD